MSKTLVIHPQDDTTKMLEEVYKDKGYDVITDCTITSRELKKQIENHDRIIMLGHGLPDGLIDPRVKDYRNNCNRLFMIDSSFADLLRSKETISIWCFSDRFFRKHNIPGFHTGMIISEIQEALYVLGYSPLSEEKLYQNMVNFSRIIHDCIDMSPEDMKNYVLEHYTGEDAITQFNRKNIVVM